MARKKAMLIVNPVSGKGESKTKIFPLADRLCRDGWEVSLEITQQRGDATRFITEKGKHFSLITAMGGDGTLNEAVTGIMESGWQGNLGYIPAGSTNDFAASLGLPKDAAKAAEIIAAGKTVKLDVGRFCDKYFAYVAAFGAFTDISYRTPQPKKNAMGGMAYVLEGMKVLGNIPSFRVSCESGDLHFFDDVLIGLVSNTRSVASFKVGDIFKTDMTDGLFEVLLIRRTALGDDINAAIKALVNHDLSSSSMIFFKTSHIKFSSDSEVPWTLDGEHGGDRHEVTIDNIPGALNMIVPEATAKSWKKE